VRCNIFGLFVYAASLKVVYLTNDHLITYQCIDSRFVKAGICELQSEQVEIFSRRRGVNTEDQRNLVELAARQSCFARNEFTYARPAGSFSLPHNMLSMGHSS
jgi:hypothetical protein